MTKSVDPSTCRFVISRSGVQVSQVAPGALSGIEPSERPFVAAARSANAWPVLPPLPPVLEAELREAWTELAGDGSALVVHASPWRWGGPGAGEIIGSLTARRWGPDGAAWDLVLAVTLDPDEPERTHLDLVVRWSNEARLVAGMPPLGQWWASTALLRLHERAAVDAAAAQAAADPPARRSFSTPDADAVPLRLDAGSLGLLQGELRIVASLGLAYVRSTANGTLEPSLAVRTLRTAVLDGRLAVPHWIRGWLDNGGPLLALEGGPL